jgi:hypothetical protein
MQRIFNLKRSFFNSGVGWGDSKHLLKKLLPPTFLLCKTINGGKGVIGISFLNLYRVVLLVLTNSTISFKGFGKRFLNTPPSLL